MGTVRTADCGTRSGSFREDCDSVPSLCHSWKYTRWSKAIVKSSRLLVLALLALVDVVAAVVRGVESVAVGTVASVAANGVVADVSWWTLRDVELALVDVCKGSL